MRRGFCLAGVALGVALLWIVWGCGDGDSTSSKLKTGELDDPEFLAAVRALDMTNVDDPTKQAYYDVSGFVQQVMSPPGIGADRDQPGGLAQQDWQITYHTDSKYWYRSLQFDEGTWVNFVDSLHLSISMVPGPTP